MSFLARLTFVLLLILMQAGLLWGAPQTVKIGVLAKRGPAYTLQKWSQTAAYLTSSSPGFRFEIVPLGFAEIHNVVKNGQVDFVLANPAFYVELEKLYGVSRIATLINQNLPGLYTTIFNLPGQPTTIFGGVIFSRADRGDITDLADLQGRSIMAVDPRSFSGWHVAWREFKRQNIDPFKDFSSLQYGTTHDAVVYAVLKGEVDAGTVRTDTLERMAGDGKINLEQLHILNQRKVRDFPYLLSTDLYPEWPMAAVKTTPNKLARLVASALMSMETGHPAAVASKSAGWTIPLNYQPVHECLLELRIGPYKDYGKFTFTDVLIHYWRQLVFVALAVVMIIVVSLYILGLNRSLRQKKYEVDELNRTLEAKVIQRTKKINTLLDQEIYLKEILHTIANVIELPITSPTMETLLKESCARLTQHGHYGFCWIGLLEKNKIQTIYTSDDASEYLAEPPYSFENSDDIFSRAPTARCIATNTTMISDHSPQESDATPWRDRTRLTDYRTVIGLPLRADQFAAPLGALTVYSWRQQGFATEEIAMLEELAGDIGFAINSFRQKDAMRKLEIERTENYEETIFAFVNMIEQRDTYTAGHTWRVANYCKMIAMEMGLENEQITKLQKAAILHDIGKIATPDSVLLKPDKLTSLDYDLIKLHASAGNEMLSKIKMYKDLADIILHHHERYDGNGYPDHLKNGEIPLLSSIMTVADAFDAMTTNRIYKSRKEISEAIIELQSLAGSQFHPEVVKVAAKVLRDVEIPKTITQLPKTELEKRRFSYFFNDKLTGLYNEDYLKIILQVNQDMPEDKCLNFLHLLNLSDYFRRQGWEKGNMLLKHFAGELHASYPETLIFRAYSNDFAIISREHFQIDSRQLNSLASIRDTEIEIEVHHIDMIREKAYTIDELEKMELLSSEA